MFRSLQENAAIVSSINLDNIAAFSGIKIDTIVFAGGASKGALWSQILSDVTGCRVKIPKVTEATALGAAMAAGVGCGIYEDLISASKELVVWDKVYEPNSANKKIYDEQKEKFKKAYKAQLQLMEEGITTSMWKAPGI
jgi:autoinducer 2 (AI-2) kinase